MIRKAVIVMLATGTVAAMLLWLWSCQGRTINIMPPQWDSGRIIIGGGGIDLWSGPLPEWKICLSALRMSIEHNSYVSVPPEHNTWITAPPAIYWAPNAPLVLMIAMVTYPTIAFIRGPLRRRRRRKRGECLACGYNLTGNVTGMCPECGQAMGTSP